MSFRYTYIKNLLPIRPKMINDHEGQRVLFHLAIERWQRNDSSVATVGWRIDRALRTTFESYSETDDGGPGFHPLQLTTGRRGYFANRGS